ncbi:MAG: PilZ domain-containing protein [Candidatus Acidiferrales bacterium]|jgi:hypothetical protein
MERRKAVRYRLAARAVFAWKGPEGNPRRAEGVTRDIGLGGAFILAGTCPPIESRVQLDIFLPPFRQSARGTKITADEEVLVVRVEHPVAGGSNGFAVVGKGFTLQRQEGPDSSQPQQTKPND